MPTLRNLTARRIEIAGRTGDLPGLVIPPFGERLLEHGSLALYDYESWAAHHLIAVQDQEATAIKWSLGSLLPGIAGASLLVSLALFTAWWVMRDTGWAYGSVLGIVVTMSFAAAGWKQVDTWHRLARSLNIFLVLVIAIGFPTATLLFVRRYGFSLNRDIFGIAGIPVLIILLTVASSLPASLYFWFHRQRLPILRQGFLRDIVRLDQNVQTTEDADRSYSRLIDDVYGTGTTGSVSTRGGLPIVLSTLLIAAMWSWTLLASAEHREDNVRYQRMVAAEAAGLTDFDPSRPPPGVVEAPPNLLSLLYPERDLVSFAFLGSYFFALGMLFRRYTRSDLGPKAYTSITVRILISLIVAWIVSFAPLMRTEEGEPNATMLLLAFMIGVVPETGTAVLQDLLQQSKRLGKAIPSLREDHPLSELDGISLYDRAHLLEVGIENVAGLAHHQLVNLMLWTRIPTSRLVDFVDQAVLYLHVRGPVSLAQQAVPAHDRGARLLLAHHGIRTATDLERAYWRAQSRSTEEATRFLGLLDSPDAPVQRLRVVLDALEDDEWMVYVRNWRDQNTLGPAITSVQEFMEVSARGLAPAPPLPALSSDESSSSNLGFERC
ncbi:MAG: hypothetical protein M3N32_12190 [Actinomycetota bacterium]|nr:hypothetical protein [Actinomycetota bacterium]